MHPCIVDVPDVEHSQAIPRAKTGEITLEVGFGWAVTFVEFEQLSPGVADDEIVRNMERSGWQNVEGPVVVLYRSMRVTFEGDLGEYTDRTSSVHGGEGDQPVVEAFGTEIRG